MVILFRPYRPIVVTVTDAIDEFVTDQNMVDMKLFFVRGFVFEGIDKIEILIKGHAVNPLVIHVNRVPFEKGTLDRGIKKKRQEKENDKRC